MNLGSQFSGLAGEPNDWDWTQYFAFKPDNGEQVKVMGEMFVVVGVRSDRNNVNSKRDGLIMTGKALASALQQRYFVSSGENTLQNLRSITTGVLQEFSKGLNIELGLVVKKNDVLFLVDYGGTGTYLFRQGMLAPILKSEGKNVITASGYSIRGDILLIGTRAFLAEFGDGRLKASLGTGRIEDVKAQFTPLIHSKESSGDIAAMFVAVEEEKQQETQRGSTILQTKSKFQNPVFNLQNNFKGFLKRSLYVKDPVEDDAFSKRRKVSASVGILLLFVLVLSIIFGVKQKKQNDFKKSYEQDVAAARHSLEESENLQSLDPERSRELFLDARGKVLGLSSDINDPEVIELRKKVEEKQGKLLGEYKRDAQLFVDLGLLSEGFSGTEMVLTQDNMYVLDTANKRIIKVAISTKHAEVVAGPSKIEEASKMAAYLDNVYILNPKGIFDVTNQDIKKVIDNTWQGKVSPLSYAGNLYILETDMSRIWRYAGSEGVFGTGKMWLSDSKTYDLTSAISWAIDGSVWVLTREGSVLKFALGNQQNFNLDKSLVGGEPFDYIYTGDGVDGLYLLDKKNSRVLVFNKEGKYKAQYINDNISQASQIVVSEKENKIILLNGNKLYAINLADNSGQ